MTDETEFKYLSETHQFMRPEYILGLPDVLTDEMGDAARVLTRSIDRAYDAHVEPNSQTYLVVVQTLRELAGVVQAATETASRIQLQMFDIEVARDAAIAALLKEQARRSS
jgi:hypothetical protein